MSQTLLTITLPFLFACALCHLLYLSFRRTGKVGLTRLMYDEHGNELPRKAKLDTWDPRWSRLESTFLLLGVLCQLAASISIGTLIVNLPVVQAAALVSTYLAAYLFFVKILAPAVANANADKISLASLPLAKPFYYALIPLAFGIDTLSCFLRRIFKPKDASDHRPTAEDEILSIAEQSDEDELEEDEVAMIKSALEFGDTVTREIMTPRVDIVSIDATISITEAAREISAANYSRFPVYENSIDTILGLIHIKDLLRHITSPASDSTAIGTLAVPVTFVPEQMHIDDLLRHLQKEEDQCAIVVDEYGGTAGLVSVEDILEELVGEIRDRYDVERDSITQEDGRAIVNARAAIDEVNEQLGLHIPDGEEYDSIGGFVLHALGRIPTIKEELQVNGCLIRVLESTSRQVTTLEILPYIEGNGDTQPAEDK